MGILVCSQQNGPAECQPVVAPNCEIVPLSSCAVVHTTSFVRPITRLVRLLNFLFDPRCKLCGTKSDSTLHMKTGNKPSLCHLVNVLRRNAENLCHFRDFQGLFAVFQYFDESHGCETFEIPSRSSQKHLRSNRPDCLL